MRLDTEVTYDAMGLAHFGASGYSGDGVLFAVSHQHVPQVVSVGEECDVRTATDKAVEDVKKRRKKHKA